jgi:hypothetical protein
MADPQQVRDVIDSAKVDQSVKAKTWDTFVQSKDATDFTSRIGALKLDPSIVKKLQTMKVAPPVSLSPQGQTPAPPGAPQPTRSFTQDMTMTPKEAAGIAVNAIPDVAGALGGTLGAAGGMGTPGSVPLSVGGATAFGAAGEGIKDWLVSHIGPKNLSGPTYQTEAPPSGGWDTAGDMAGEGLKQGAGQFVGEKVLSPIIRGVFGGPMHQAVNESANKFVKAANEEYGLHLTPPEVSGKKAPGWGLIQRIGSYNYFAQEVARRSRELGADNAVTAMDETLQSLTHSPTPAIHSTPTSSGKTWQALVDMSRTIFKAQANQQYEDLAKEATGVPINMQGVKNEAKNLLKQYAPAMKAFPDTGGPGAASLKILRDIADGPDQVPFEVAKQLRSNLLDVTPQSEELMAGKAQGIAKDMVKNLHQAIGDSLTINKPSAVPLWEQANKFYKDGIELLNNDIVTGLMDAGHPEILADAIKSGRDQETTAKMIRNAVLDQPMAHGSPAEKNAAQMGWKQFQEQFIRSNVIGIPEGQSDLAAEMIMKDPAGIYNRLRDIGPGVRDTIFGAGSEGRKAFDNVSRVAEALSRIQKLPVESRQFMNEAIRMGVSSTLTAGAAALEYGGNVGAMGLGATVGAVGFEVVPLMIMKSMHSEAGSKYLADGIGGLLSSIDKLGIDKLGKGLIKLQDKTITSPASNKYLGAALSNIGRAWREFSNDQDNMAETARSTAQALDPLTNPYKRH